MFMPVNLKSRGKAVQPCGRLLSGCEECAEAAGCGLKDLRSAEGAAKAVPLSKMPAGSGGRIAYVKGDGKVIRRLFDLGLTPGTAVAVSRFSPFRSSIEIFVRGSRLALGKEICSGIFVEPGVSGGSA